MKEDIFKILSNSNKDIDNQKLMDYLSGKLSDREQHDVEEWLAASDFASDAIEGLEGFRKGGKLDSYVAELNKDLHQYLQQNRERRKKRKISDWGGMYIAVIIVLLIIILAFIVLQRL